MEEITSIDQLREMVIEPNSEQNVSTTREEPPEVKVEAKEPIKEEVKDEKEAVEEIKAKEPEKEAQEEGHTEDLPKANEFVPNYKFKAGGQEFEVPDSLKASIKDEATQLQITELLEKAYGLDDLKPRHIKQKERLEFYEKEVVPNFQKQNEVIEELTGYIKAGDYRSYFERLGVDITNVQKWMLQELSLTPEQKELYNKNRELQKQLFQRETENQSLSQSAEAAKRESHEAEGRKILQELDFVLTQNDYKNAVSSFDAKHGTGTFKNKVMQFAAFKAQTENVVLSPVEAVKAYMEFIPPVTANAAPNNKTGETVIPKEKPILPQVAARAQAPAAKQITSIRQLRERANELASEN